MVKEFKSQQYPDSRIVQVVLRAINSSLTESARVWKLPKMTVFGWVEAYKEGRISVYEHLHYWDLPSPNGPMVTGVCRACLEQRDFGTSESFRGWRHNRK